MSKRLQIILILVFLWSTLVFTQDQQMDEDKQLREEIMSVYKSGGKQGLRDYFKKNQNKISNKFIVGFAEAGKNERKEEWLNICEVIAEERKDEKTLADVLYKKGNYFKLISNNKKATAYFDKAFSLYLILNDLVGQGNVYLRKGGIYFYTGDNAKALEMYDKALSFFEKVGGDAGKGSVYLEKGVVYLRIGETSKALEMYERALSFYKKAGISRGLGNVYFLMGVIYSRRSENSKALEMYDKALPFYEKVGAYLGQGNIYLRKGVIYFYIGDISRTLVSYNKALPFFEKAGAVIPQGNVYLRKASIFLFAGENSKALELYDKALLFYKKAGEPLGQGNVYRNIGNIYLKKGKNSSALAMYEKALPFYKKAREPIGQGNIYLKKGDIYHNTEDNSKALAMYEKALLFFEKVSQPIGQGNVYQSKGDVYFDSGDYSKSFEMYNKALLFYLKAGDIDSESFALHGKAKTLAKLGKTEKALKIFERGIANLEEVRRQTVFSEMKRTLMERVYKQYEETVLFMMGNNYYEKGFKYAETMRARLFLDQLAEGFVGLEKGLAPGLKEYRDKVVGKLSQLKKEMHNAIGKKNEEKLCELKEQYAQIESEFEEVLVKIRVSNPLYASVEYPQPVSVQELQTRVLKKGELLVRYFITSDKLYVFLVSMDNFKVVTLDVKEKEIKGNVNRYLSAMKENNSRSVKWAGKKLYQMIFKPLEIELEGNRDVIIVPDGELARIPFESLLLEDDRYLMEKYPVKYVQSASVLSVLREYYHRDSGTKRFIGFGDPVYDYERFKLGKPEQGAGTPFQEETDEKKEIFCSRYARAGGIMSRLQASGEEIKTIARLFEKVSQKSVVQLREQASEDNAKVPGIKDFDYIHFACHGLLNDDFQSLVLSQLPPDKSREDGYFTLNEIMNCDYNAKLVVLSACQTGSGKMYKGEGVTGLTRAVMYAGTPAVVASLWDVDDTATKELMVRFYRNMLEKNMDKTEALRQAKLELLKTGEYASPLFWSAFIMYGE